MFDVVWSTNAENELAAIWLDPSWRAAATRASQLIDERLERNADDEGESRPGNHRIAFESPLGALFHIDEASKRVTVVHVWVFGKR